MKFDLGEVVVPTAAGAILGYALGRKRGAMIGAVVLGGAAVVGSMQRPDPVSMPGQILRRALQGVDVTKDSSGDPTAAIGAAAAMKATAANPAATGA